MHTRSIAIIGAGFSGTLLAVHLLRRAPSGVRISLIERSTRFATGLAYGTGNASHLLNVPADRMGAFHDKPDDFLSWLQVQPDTDIRERNVSAGAFLPRSLYGEYLRSLLASTARQPAKADLNLIHDDVVGLEDCDGNLVLTLASGHRLHADAAVLAMGNFVAPAVCPGLDNSSMWRSDPWQDNALSGMDPASRVLLIGAGLTMADAAIALLDAGHTGPIHAVSRRGLLPRIHTATPISPPASIIAYPIRLTALTRLLRTEAERAIAEGRPWQGVIDALRPVAQDLWQAMSPADKRRFLRHVRCWWDIFRHRMAPVIAGRIKTARASGQLHITAGRIVHCKPDGDRMDILIRARGDKNPLPLRVARVINCAGLTSDITQVKDPLLQGLLRQGLVRPDPLALGLDVDLECAVVARDGATSSRLYAVGPVTKGVFWEIVAVPDIRRQCDILAHQIVDRLR